MSPDGIAMDPPGVYTIVDWQLQGTSPMSSASWSLLIFTEVHQGPFEDGDPNYPAASKEHHIYLDTGSPICL